VIGVFEVGLSDYFYFSTPPSRPSILTIISKNTKETASKKNIPCCKMVRVKNRYLVVNFLYPTTPSATCSSSKSTETIPDLLQFHAPTPDAFHMGHLLRVIKDGIQELFGDYGMGMVSNALKGNPTHPLSHPLHSHDPK
jgi:hypothetical protein